MAYRFLCHNATSLIQTTSTEMPCKMPNKAREDVEDNKHRKYEKDQTTKRTHAISMRNPGEKVRQQ